VERLFIWGVDGARVLSHNDILFCGQSVCTTWKRHRDADRGPRTRTRFERGASLISGRGPGSKSM
jgi:hypothetical protein